MFMVLKSNAFVCMYKHQLLEKKKKKKTQHLLFFLSYSFPKVEKKKKKISWRMNFSLEIKYIKSSTIGYFNHEIQKGFAVLSPSSHVSNELDK